jgi:APA family basic amino acid/polyamine antiporter
MPSPPAQLKRELGLFGAVMMGLGSIIGTGVFVSIVIGTQTTGASVIVAIAIAGVVAACNALSSAQLAASHPTSGGTYEYGYVYLSPTLGFSAGWMFLCAKSASAATAALGFAGYTLSLAGTSPGRLNTLVALGAVAALGVVVLSGLRRSNWTNLVIVAVTLIALSVFCIAGLPRVLEQGQGAFSPFLNAERPLLGLLEATALMFVAYTGYGRIATLGEEVREPRRTIPRAIMLTLLVSMALYIAVGVVATAGMGGLLLEGADVGRTAPLSTIADGFGMPGVGVIVSVGAITAMLGVLLNLILGLSRIALAMGRRGDLPASLARIDTRGTTPTTAVIFVMMIVSVLTAIGSIRLAWSFSAFTVLIYYAITNLASIRLSSDARLYPMAVSWCGLIGCLLLAFFVEPRIWVSGLGILAGGLLWRVAWRRVNAS